VTLTGAAEALRVPAHRVSGAFFDVLGVDAASGRTLGADDDRPGATPVVVLGDAIWRRVFGAEGAEVAILGALVGVAVAMGTTRLLSRWLFAVSPTDPMVLIGLAIAVVAVASLAAWVPAHRAATIDPVEALSVE